MSSDWFLGSGSLKAINLPHGILCSRESEPCRPEWACPWVGQGVGAGVTGATSVTDFTAEQ